MHSRTSSGKSLATSTWKYLSVDQDKERQPARPTDIFIVCVTGRMDFIHIQGVYRFRIVGYGRLLAAHCASYFWFSSEVGETMATIE